MRMLKSFFIICALAMMGYIATATAEPTMQTTNIHRIITHQQGWLNTSRALTPEDLKGRIILLDFWTFCCINCMHVIPDLEYLEKTFGDKLTVIGVHSAKFKNEQDSENIRAAILRYGIHHPVVNDFDFSTWKAMGIHAWPTFVLINPMGTVQAIYAGEGNRQKAERDIAALIKKYEGSINTTPLPIALEADKQPPGVLSFPGKLATDGEHLFVADSGHQRIAIMTMDGKITDSIGSGNTGKDDGAFEQASFNTPQGLAYKNGLLYIADTNNHALRLADLKTRQVTTLAGNGGQRHEPLTHAKPASQTQLSSPWGLAFSPDDTHLAIAMAGLHQIWSYDINAKTLSVIAGNGHESMDDGYYPHNSLAQPSGLSALDDWLFFVDAETSSVRLLREGRVYTLVGTGLFAFGYKEGVVDTALMQHPLGLFATQEAVYIADSYNHSIRLLAAAGQLSNFIGHGVRGNKDGAFATAEFNEPNDILLIGKKLYIADTNNNAIRVADLDTKMVSTLNVSEPKRSSAPELSQQLPNAEISEADIAADQAIDLTIALQKDWHINKAAPSALAIFDAQKKPVASFGKEALQQPSVALPALAKGDYRLQATLYYCADKTGAQCLLKSFDIALHAKAGGEKTITLRLN